MVQTLLGELTELTRAFQEIDHIKIDNFLGENDGEWILWKKKPTTIEKHGRSLGMPDLKCKSNIKLLTEDSWK